MYNNIAKCLLVVSLSVVVTGCKLAVMVPSGGDVTSASGTRNCSGKSVCEFEITSPTFSDSFTAVAKPGYQFVKWNTGGGFLCPNSTSPTCTVTLTGDANSANVVATFTTAYVMPVFKDIGIDTDGDTIRNELDDDDDGDGILDIDDYCSLDPSPECAQIMDTVTANSQVWAQPDLFDGLSWDDINAVCPEGACIAGGRLNGYIMDEWRWASVEEINDLFNYYIGSPQLGPGPDTFQEDAASWGQLFFADGWRPLSVNENLRSVSGRTSDVLADPRLACMAYIVDYVSPTYPYDAANSCNATLKDTGGGYGAWFYRIP